MWDILWKFDITQSHVFPKLFLQKLLQSLCIVGKPDPVVGKHLVLQLEIQLPQLGNSLLRYSCVRQINIIIK